MAHHHGRLMPRGQRIGLPGFGVALGILCGLMLAMMAAANPVMAHGTGHKKTAAGSVMAGDDGDSAADTAAVNSWQPSFDLVDQRNQPRRASDFQGRFMLVFLGYTACPDVCPASLGTMKQLLNGLDKGQAASIAPIFLSVDPASDTPAHLANYLGALDPRLIGLTGSEGQVAAAVKSFKAYVARQPADAKLPKDEQGRVDHTAFFYLLDRQGRFVSILDPTQPLPKLIAALKLNMR